MQRGCGSTWADPCEPRELLIVVSLDLHDLAGCLLGVGRASDDGSLDGQPSQ